MLTDDEKRKLRAEEFFREEVRREIRPPKSKWESLWAMLNRPLSMYILSVVLLGGLANVYQNLQQEKAEQEARNKALSDSFIELADALSLHINLSEEAYERWIHSEWVSVLTRAKELHGKEFNEVRDLKWVDFEDFPKDDWNGVFLGWEDLESEILQSFGRLHHRAETSRYFVHSMRDVAQYILKLSRLADSGPLGETEQPYVLNLGLSADPAQFIRETSTRLASTSKSARNEFYSAIFSPPNLNRWAFVWLFDHDWSRSRLDGLDDYIKEYKIELRSKIVLDYEDLVVEIDGLDHLSKELRANARTIVEFFVLMRYYLDYLGKKLSGIHIEELEYKTATNALFNGAAIADVVRMSHSLLEFPVANEFEVLAQCTDGIRKSFEHLAAGNLYDPGLGRAKEDLEYLQLRLTRDATSDGN